MSGMSDDPSRSRTVIRLKHSLAADEEIKAVLPDTLDEFEAAYAKGERKKLTDKTVASVLDGTDEPLDRGFR